MTRLEFQDESWNTPKLSLQIKDGYLSCSLDGPIATSDAARTKLSEAQLRELEQRIDRSGSSSWKEEYVDPMVCDGFQYQLTINGKSCWMSNKTPPGFSELMDYLWKLAGMDHELDD